MGVKKVFSKAMALTLAGVVTFQGATAHATVTNTTLYRKSLEYNYNNTEYTSTDSMTFGANSNEFYVLKHRVEKQNGENVSTNHVSVSYYVRNKQTAKKTRESVYTYDDAFSGSHANSIAYCDGKLCVATCGDYVTRIDVSGGTFNGRANYEVVNSNYKKLTKVPGTDKNIKVGAITHLAGKLYLVRFDNLRFAVGQFEVHAGKKVFKIVSNFKEKPFYKGKTNLGYGTGSYQDITYYNGFMYVASFNKENTKQNEVLKFKVEYDENTNELKMGYDSKFELTEKGDNRIKYEVEGLCIHNDNKKIVFCTNENGNNKADYDSIYLYK